MLTPLSITKQLNLGKLWKKTCVDSQPTAIMDDSHEFHFFLRLIKTQLWFSGQINRIFPTADRAHNDTIDHYVISGFHLGFFLFGGKNSL